MKINLLYDSNDILSGYHNVNPFDFSENNICCDLGNLEFCSVGEAEEILCNDILSHYTKEEVNNMLVHYISRLAHGGSLTVTDINSYEVARQFTLGKLNSDQFNIVLFGQKHPSKSITNLTEVVNIMTRCGLKIRFKKIDGFKFTVTGVRP